MSDIADHFRQLDADLAQDDFDRPEGPARAASGRVVAIRPRSEIAPVRRSKPADTVVTELKLGAFLSSAVPTEASHTAVTLNPYAEDLETLEECYFTLVSDA